MTRPTEMYPRAWIAHHKLQYGPNWRHVSAKFVTRKEGVEKCNSNT